MTPVLPACAVVGHGRLGTALAAALRAAGASVDGPLDRGAIAHTADDDESGRMTRQNRPDACIVMRSAA